MHLNKYSYILVIVLSCFVSCKHEPFIPDYSNTGYPSDISPIIVNNCATTGCHNNISYKAAGGLNLTTWSKLFSGGNTGAVIIPYRPDFSTLCYYTNTDTNLGVTLIPTMPVNATPLSTEEYIRIKEWVANGATSNKGQVIFSGDAMRKKLYVTNKLCDVVTVFDAQTLLQMRYIDVGVKAGEEFPHKVLVSPDKRNWYVSFFATSNVVQKFDAINDKLVGNIELGPGSWTSFDITEDSRYGYFISNKKQGKIAYVDLEKMQLINIFDFNGTLSYPSGCIVNSKLNKLYVGNSFGNYINVIDITDKNNPTLQQFVLDGSGIPQNNSSLDPAELLLNTTDNICYIGCIHSADIRVIDMKNDSMITTIPVGSNPVSMSLSQKRKQLFVTCPDDEVSFPGERGAVVVIDITRNTILKKVYSGYQPYGIAVDNEQDIIAVVNANLNSDGDEPHHSSDCDGRNGYVSFIDPNSLEEIPGLRSEVAVFPYSISCR